MGSWSVYCGISQVVITEGQQCVLLPLKPNKSYSVYDKMIPATLPIYGVYADYGDLGEVERTDNVALIEEYFKCTIEEFTYLLQRRGIDERDSDEYPNKELFNNLELKEWSYMWIDRKVYDFLASYVCQNYFEGGDLDYGKKEMLDLLGFTFVETSEDNPTYDPKRFRQKYIREGIVFYSDGETLLHTDHNYITQYKDLKAIAGLPDSFDYLATLTTSKGWRLLSDKDAKEELLWIVGGSTIDSFQDTFEELTKSLYDTMNEEEKRKFDQRVWDRKPKTMLQRYKDSFKTYGDELANLINIRHHLHYMSGTWAPYTLYLTPQFGERESHQVLLDKFSEINKSYMEGSED